MHIVLVDDHVSFRESFRIALSAETNFVVVGESSSAREGAALISQTSPALAVIDLLLADTDGVALARELRRQQINVPVLMLTRVAHEAFVRDALEAGVSGYVLKSQPFGEVVQAMRAVAGGERYIAPDVERVLNGDANGAPVERADALGKLRALSRREREIFGRVVQGFSNKDIAKLLCISLRTVESHRLSINGKLGVRSPAELMSFAAGLGLPVE